jgi:hypothetical protein
MTREAYLRYRRDYEPEEVTLAIIAESPPASGKFFYDPSGTTAEPLFAALIKQIGICPCTKQDGLMELQRRGWILIDSTYQPVNSRKISDRNSVIVGDYGLLCADLSSLIPDRSAPLLLIKANVCRILEPRLVQNGFNVLNHGEVVYFPANGWQRKFHQQFGAIRSRAGI